MDQSNWQVDLGHGMGPLVLGASRDAVLARLAEAKIECEPDDDEPTWLYLPDMETELTFSEGEPRRLVQISVEDERVVFGTLPVLGKRVHEIVELLQVPESETLWRAGEDPSLSLPLRDDQPPPTASDRELLDAGTLWITTLGLGLHLWRGEVVAVHLRQPQDSPRSGVGPFLRRHAELSRREDLPSQLAKPYLPDAPDQAMGLANSRDAAFIKFIPWGIGVVVVYALLQFVPVLMGWFWQRPS